LRRWLAGALRDLRPAVAASAAGCAAERYRKHFDAYAHTCLLLFHGLATSPSLRQSYAAFAACPGLVALSGLGGMRAERLRVSRSQLSASNTSRPPAFLGGLVPGLVARVRRLERSAQRALPPDLHILDSTFLRLSLRLAPWLGLSRRTKRPGVCVQVQYAPTCDLPEHILITDAHTPDVKGLDQAILDDPARLAALAGQTLVLDLGYYSHARFARLRRAQVHFVSRLHPQATFRVAEERPVQAPLPGLEGGRIRVLSDQRIALGSAHNRAGAVLQDLRLVTARVAPTPAAARQGQPPQVYRLLTDRWDLSAAEVVQLYLWRWEIELFFRWLKSHIRLPRLLGTSPQAVELSVWLALVVHLLAVLAAHALGYARRSPALLRQLPFALAQLCPADLRAPPPTARQLALPFRPP
jgi:hypothetical protein